MIRFPNGKINLGLHVTSKREDGYHNIETCFYPVALKDALEIIPSGEMHFECSGFKVEGTVENNLCLKAYYLLHRDFPEITPLKIHLHKAIPMGAGLGGGSSNGAFMLKMINEKFRLQLADDVLIKYALQLGSDCPFFILNKPCFATSRGEVLQPLHVDLSMYKMVLINPGIHVSTARAFSTLKPKLPAQPLPYIIQQPVAAWKDALGNDFEDSIFKLRPAIKEIKQELYSQGAIYASMTGSGSTVYGFFERDTKPKLSFPGHYTVINLESGA